MNEGGLGLPCLRTLIPELTEKQLSRLNRESYPAAKAAYMSARVQKKLQWAKRMADRYRDSSGNGARQYWTRALHASVDGYELRESGKTTESTGSIAQRSHCVPGRDYIQYVHTHINTLPSRIRTSRGQRENRVLACRAGCLETETTAHIIQNCPRTHGGRIHRHNAVAHILAENLNRLGYVTEEEPPLRTTVGLRKPDILAVKGSKVTLIDAQIVSGATALDDAHNRKSSYYRDVPSIRDAVAEHLGVEQVRDENFRVTSCTISWRGVWSHKSSKDLRKLGLTVRTLMSLTTRVLQGSHMNFTRYMQMTSRARRSTNHQGRPQHDSGRGVGPPN